MKSKLRILVVLVAGGIAAPCMGQGLLGRIEARIRQANGQPNPPGTAATPRVYLGAIANDEAGRGVRISTVHAGSPAEHAGLQPQDLVVGAAGRRIRILSDLTATLGAMNPGDRLALEVMRGTKPARIEVVLGAQPGGNVPHVAERPALPPTAEGIGAGSAETIPPPPGDVGVAPQPVSPPPVAPPALIPPAPEDGPALTVPQPVAPNSPQAQIDDLQHRVDQLERRVKDLERARAESQKK